VKKEPAVIIGAIGSVVTSIVALLVAFGLNLTVDQQTAIVGVVLTVTPLIVGLITRQYVFAPATVAALEEEPEVKPRRALEE
jgi:hypothetical protein